MTDTVEEETKIYGIEFPPVRWKFWLCMQQPWGPQKATGSHIYFNVHSAPCWFHRLMQRWLLGIIWEKIKEADHDQRN